MILIFLSVEEEPLTDCSAQACLLVTHRVAHLPNQAGRVSEEVIGEINKETEGTVSHIMKLH